MKLSPVTNGQFAVNFKAAPTKNGLAQMDKLCTEGEKLLSEGNSSTMFDFYQWSAPSKPENDTGVGKFTSDESVEFIKTMKPYVGFDREKIYPIGRFVKKTAAQDGYYCPYERGSLTIGEDNIDFSKLTTPKYGEILSENDIKPLVNSNKGARGDVINYENEMGENLEYPITELLRQGFENFKKLPEGHELKAEFEEYKKSPLTENYDRLALFQHVAEDDPDLFLNFEQDIEKQQRFLSYKQKYKDEIEFYKFNQFIAYKQVQEAKKQYNDAGVEITGDLAIGFNDEEYWAFKDAFHFDKSIGYNFPLIRYEDMTDKNSPAYKLFKQKVSFMARNFDGVRLDVGVSYGAFDYVTKKDGKWDEENKLHYDNKDVVYNIIDDTFREIKGENYNPDNITYEAEGASQYFIDWSGKPTSKKPLSEKNLILSTLYEKQQNLKKKEWGYGSVDFYTNVAGLSPNHLVMGTANHDGTPTRKIADSKDDKRLLEFKKNSIPVLQKALRLKKEYLNSANNWFRAKMAEILLAPKRFIFFQDVFGKSVAIDDCEGPETGRERYRYRMPLNYEEEYNRELQNDNGYNRPEALSMALRAKGFDKSHPVLFKKLEFLGKYLRKQGALTTEEADKQAALRGQDEVIENLKRIEH